MQPYYKRNGITIYHGDCGDILPSLARVDLVITDPPYGMKWKSGTRLKKRHGALVGDEYLPLDLIEMAIAKAIRAAYVFCRWDNIEVMPKPIASVMAWIKNNDTMGNLHHAHGRMWEAICFYPQKRHEFIRRIPDVLYAPQTGNDLHPTQKPVELLSRLIRCNQGRTVLDPFMGSGSTLVAAKALGRRAIGIELEERWCEAAAKRLDLGNVDARGDGSIHAKGCRYPMQACICERIRGTIRPGRYAGWVKEKGTGNGNRNIAPALLEILNAT